MSSAIAEIVTVRRKSIAWRLTVAFGTIIVALGLVSTACIWALVDTHRRLHAVKDDEAKARMVIQLASAVRDQYAFVARTIILANDSHASQFRLASRRLAALARAVGRQAGLAAAQDRLARILTAGKEVELLFETEVIPMVRAGDRAELIASHERVLALAITAQGDAEALVAAAEGAMEDVNRHVRAMQHGAIRLTIVSQIVALVTAALVGIYLHRSIARPVATLSAATARIAGGDLETEVPAIGHHEFGELGKRFNYMTRALREDQQKLLETEKVAGLARVAAGIAHELNNPLGVILGYAKLLRRGDAATDPRILAAIEEEAERCHQVIEDLLELTRGGDLRAEAVDLRHLTEEVVQRARLARPGSTVDVVVDGSATALGDPRKLAQVLTNLVANAIDAAGKGGRVTIAIGAPGSRQSNVVVTDTGPGVPSSIAEQVFEPFFTTKPSGTGLGLAISRAIARAHGGDLRLAPSSGPGAAFELTLPAMPEGG